MLPRLDPITVDSVSFLVLTGGLMLLAWSPAKRFFPQALAAAGGLMTLSWLGRDDLFALIFFLPIPYLTTKFIWGRKQLEVGGLVAAVIALQVITFLIFKRYAWFDVLSLIGHPVKVIGISYILFRQIHLVIDARYLGHMPFSLVRYLAYMLSPWTLVAGPIQRYDGFCHGLDEVGRPETGAMLDGAHRAVNGLIRAFVLAPLFLEPSRISNLGNPDATWVDFLVVFYGFPVYLYLNFAGYTDLMIGAARLCGFSNLPENFNHPYLARNTRDFWTRWHMSFGMWIKHYVFTPLSTRLIKVTQPRWHRLMMIVTVLVTFYIVGAWHGTTVNYFIFGFVQAGGVIVSAAFEGWRKRLLGRDKARAFNQKTWFKVASITVALNFTCLSLLLLNGDSDAMTTALMLFFG